MHRGNAYNIQIINACVVKMHWSKICKIIFGSGQRDACC